MKVQDRFLKYVSLLYDKVRFPVQVFEQSGKIVYVNEAFTKLDLDFEKSIDQYFPIFQAAERIRALHAQKQKKVARRAELEERVAQLGAKISSVILIIDWFWKILISD